MPPKQQKSLPKRQQAKLSKDEFRNLQHEWYEKLAQSGFKDIEKFENGEFVLTYTTAQCFRNDNEYTKEFKEEYFRCLYQQAFSEDAVYRNDIDRHILTRYAEGAKIKTIVHELNTMGESRHRHTVRFIIRRYEIKWGLKYYRAEQLTCNRKRA